MSSEQIILNEGGTLVSTTRVVVHGTTDPTNNITSVRKARKEPATGCAVVFLILSILIAAGGFVDMSTGVWVWGVIGLIIAVVWLRMLKPTYTIVFSAASGEIKALESKDEPTIDAVVGAINQAIVTRG